MGKDLTRRTDLTKKSERTKTERMRSKTEVERAQEALAEGMLFGASARPQQDAGPPGIILGLDCTSSMGEFIEPRKITADAASRIANGLFAEGPAKVLLIYFRGDGSKQPRQLRASNKWYTTSEELARKIAAIELWPGWTQHCALLRHAIAEAEKQAVQQVVIISDAFERQTPRRPDGDDLIAARIHAARLRDLGVKLVVGYKGTIRGACPLDRAGVGAEQAFRDITHENGGYVFLFDPATAADRFAEIATQAALAAKGDTADAQKLLEHLQTVSFEMTVGEQAPSARCVSKEGSEGQ